MKMNYKTWKWTLTILTLVALGCTSAIRAQEPETQAQPKPAGRGIPSVDDTNSQDANDLQSGWTPDTMPLTGLQSPSVGSPVSRHSYWVPGLQYSSTIQNQPSSGGTSGSWYSNNYFGANLSLLQQWTRSQLTLNYSGGGIVTTQSGQNNGWYQQLALGQNIMWERWQLQILDQFAYLPESQFGFGVGTGLALPGIGGSLGPTVPGIGSAVTPGQSIYATIGPRYSNAFVGQLTYQISRRSSVTFGGSYGLLRFTEAGNVDTTNYIGNAGYNYQLTKNNSIGLAYRFTAYHYQGEPQAIGDQLISFSFGRKITKRIGLQLYGGPDITSFRVPVNNQKQTIAGSGGASLNYAFQRGSLSLSYFHGLTGGSGVLIGSNTDQVTIGGSRQLNRLWSINGNFGFGANRPLANQTGITGNDYNSIYVGGGVARPIGRNFNFSASYTAQIQKANATVCTGTGCNASSTQNIITISLQWHTRPFVLE